MSENNDNLKEAVKQGVEHLDFNSDQIEQEGIIEIQCQAILDKLRKSDQPVPTASQQKLLDQVRECLKNATQSGNAYGTFCTEWNEFRRDWDDTSPLEYDFYFPLRVGGLAGEYDVGEVNLKQIDRSEWIEGIESLPDSDDETEVNYRKKIDELEEEISGSLFDEYDNTFWNANIKRQGKADAYLQFRRSLEFFLGKINYNFYYKSSVRVDANSIQSLTNRRPMGVLYPQCILVFENGGALEPITSERSVTKSPMKISNPKDIDGQFDIPEEGSNELYDGYVRAIRSVYHALTGETPGEIFHGYWRSLERLTLTNPGDRSGDVLDRATVNLDDEFGEIPAEVVDLLTDQRNNFIHEDTGPDITSHQINILKLLVERMVDMYVEKLELERPEWTTDELRNIFEYSDSGDDKLAKMLKNHLVAFDQEGQSGRSGRQHLEEARRVISVYQWRSMSE